MEKILRKEEDGNELIMSFGSEGCLIYTFDKPVEDDTGTYTCIVSNHLGEDRAVIKLFVGGNYVLYLKFMYEFCAYVVQSKKISSSATLKSFEVVSSFLGEVVDCVNKIILLTIFH